MEKYEELLIEKQIKNYLNKFINKTDKNWITFCVFISILSQKKYFLETKIFVKI